MSKLIEALYSFQADPPELRKDSENPHFGNTYISLGSLLKAVLPRLNELGLVLVQQPDNLDGGPALTTKLWHIDEPENILESTVPIVLERDTSQALGSGITYTRRYSIVSIFALDADEDDDGEAASSDEDENRDSPLGSTKF